MVPARRRGLAGTQGGDHGDAQVSVQAAGSSSTALRWLNASIEYRPW